MPRALRRNGNVEFDLVISRQLPACSQKTIWKCPSHWVRLFIYVSHCTDWELADTDGQLTVMKWILNGFRFYPFSSSFFCSVIFGCYLAVCLFNDLSTISARRTVAVRAVGSRLLVFYSNERFFYFSFKEKKEKEKRSMHWLVFFTACPPVVHLRPDGPRADGRMASVHINIDTRRLISNFCFFFFPSINIETNNKKKKRIPKK